jgi:hypothetical protein
MTVVIIVPMCLYLPLETTRMSLLVVSKLQMRFAIVVDVAVAAVSDVERIVGENVPSAIVDDSIPEIYESVV